MNKKILLIVGCLLIAIGLIRPEFNFNHNTATDNISKPANADLLVYCDEVSDAVRNLSKYDAKRLAGLYVDLSTLITLDGEDEVVKTTEDIRQANSIAGNLLKLNIKGKCPELPQKTTALIVAAIGDDSVSLDKDLRKKASEAFMALAWACDKGAK